LDVGRRARLAVRRQRRALATVFRCCAFPGCQVPFRFTEIHHKDFWCKGGKTDLDLLVPYCWEHVRREALVDRAGVRDLRRSPDAAGLRS
jgi:hypothetical protein